MPNASEAGTVGTGGGQSPTGYFVFSKSSRKQQQRQIPRPFGVPLISFADLFLFLKKKNFKGNYTIAIRNIVVNSPFEKGELHPSHCEYKVPLPAMLVTGKK
jgi:hypothetical protein